MANNGLQQRYKYYVNNTMQNMKLFKFHYFELIVYYLILCFLDSEPESEDSYYGTPRNNNNKRRKSRGILKTTPSE